MALSGRCGMKGCFEHTANMRSRPVSDVSEKSTVEFAQVASSDSASEDYIIHITDRTMPRLPLNS